MDNHLILYQNEHGNVMLDVRLENETVWLSQAQMSVLFGKGRSTITEHIQNIFKEGELDEKLVCRDFRHTTQHGSIKGKTQSVSVKYYNLDVIISVGYRVKSLQGTQFRIWATKRLRDHIVQWFTINPDRIKHNYQAFLKAIDDMKALINNNTDIKADDILDLIKSFGQTWFSLDHFDRCTFPQPSNQQEISLTATELMHDIHKLKQTLMQQWQASDLFAQEKMPGNLEWIVWNVFQSVFGVDAYPSIEEKAAHLLYFIVKNHPFDDGNKRSGAFAFIRFLQKVWFDFAAIINPQTLATLTILIAQSDPKEKEKMIWLVLLLLSNQQG